MSRNREKRSEEGRRGTNLSPLPRTEISLAESGRSDGMQRTKGVDKCEEVEAGSPGGNGGGAEEGGAERGEHARVSGAEEFIQLAIVRMYNVANGVVDMEVGRCEGQKTMADR